MVREKGFEKLLQEKEEERDPLLKGRAAEKSCKCPGHMLLSLWTHGHISAKDMQEIAHGFVSTLAGRI